MEHIGRYQIVKELGRGAMGVVYQAVDPTIGRTVAIKTIRMGDVTNLQERAKLQERLFREARSAGILSHPNIVTIYDMQEEGDLTYIAMEFVDGPTLDALMSAPKPIPRDSVLRILREAASGLDYAHQKGIVHRDIKPANIMLDAGGQVKITDFGIAKVTTSEQYTMTGTIIGTPNYMSPEQVQGLPTVDGRSDQFSLSVIAYEMLTGEKPFTGEHLTTVVYKIVSGDPEPPQRLNPTLGGQIDTVLRKGLAKKPDGRYLSCLEFVIALERACAATKGWVNLSRGASQDMPTVGPAAAGVLGSTGAGRPAMPPPHARRASLGDTTTSVTREHRHVSMVTVLLAIFVAAGLVGLVAWQAAPWLTQSGQPSAAQSTTPASGKPPETAKSQPAPDKPSPLKTPEQTPTPAPEAQKPEEPKPEAPKPEAQAPETGKPETPPGEETPQSTPAPKSETPRQERPKPPSRTPPMATVPQAVGIVTTPSGALAELDGRSAISCRTPCTLQVPPGRHTIQLTLAGYQTEFRAIDVTSGPQDLPVINMRSEAGTLMITSAPTGAIININGRQRSEVTPAQIGLAPGSYAVVVSKDGKTASRQIQIKNGSITVVRVTLE